MLWLGHHALQNQHLTTPAQESAYYYYARVLQLEPANADAQAGIRAIARRYAELAEAALTRGDNKLAFGYVALGRRLDPTSEALNMLLDLAPAAPPNLWHSLRVWWERRGT